jgi:hypothetical protein
MKIWMDSEFNGFGGELISIALVDENRCGFYGSLGCKDPMPWVAENVMPFLGTEPIGRPTLQRELQAYLSKYSTIELIADWPEDIAHFCGLMIVRPGECMTLPPLTMTLCSYAAVPSELPHNAYHDALALRQAAMEIAP